MFHVQVPFRSPDAAGNMTEPGANQHQGRFTIWESPDNFGPAFDFPIDPLQNVVCPDSRPVLCGKVHVGERFCHTVSYLLSGLEQLHLSELCLNCLGFLKCGCLILLGM